MPLLTKEIVKDNQDLIRLPQAHHVRKTGGSTGQSVYFFYDDEGLDWTAAVNLLAYEMAGNFPHKGDCHISSELGLTPATNKDKVIDWLKLFSQNRSRLMISSFSDSDMLNTYNDLVRIRPFLLQGHPSTAYALSNYIKTNIGKGKKYCSVFEPSGEMLTDKMVKSIEEYMGCKVVNRYGNAEFGVIAHSRQQDTYQKMIVFNRLFYAEECEKNNVIVSNCTNYSFPLFRYDTGDIATIKNTDEGTFITEIQGRVHDTVNIAGDDYATHFIMDYLDHKVRGVREFQILIRNSKNPLLQIVPENKNDFDRIRQELLARWPIGLEVSMTDFDSLRRSGWQQKFRHIVKLGGDIE